MKTYLMMTGVLATFAAGVLTSSSAQAWFIPDQFSGPYFRNAGGNHYTGAPRGIYSCDGCHIGAEDFPPSQRISLMVTSQRVNGSALEAYDLFASGYVPGDRYKIRVEMMGEHRGHYTGDGSYEDPEGTAWKVECPSNDPGGVYTAQIHNHNHITAEVMNEDGVYADHAGNEAGRLRPDATGGPTAEGPCLSTVRCPPGNDPLPTAFEDGGPTSLMARHWVVDPNSNPPLGNWSCGTCDALVTNSHEMPSPASEGGFDPFYMEFFWQAPDNVPATEGGRIRFYMAGVDGDGYTDTMDDDFASVRVAVCPAGTTPAECDPMVGPGWGLGLMASPPAGGSPPAELRAAAADPGVGWMPILTTSLFVLLSVVAVGRWRGGREVVLHQA